MPSSPVSPSPGDPAVEPETPARQGPSPGLLLFLVMPVIGLAIATGLLLADAARQPATSDQPAVAITPRSVDAPARLRFAPPDLETVTIDGQPVNLEDFAGRPVFVNFWATWCLPCVRELPALQAFAAAQDENGAVVLAVNSGETPEDIRTFLADNDIDLDNVIILMDEDLSTSRAYGIAVMPTTYVIGSNGLVEWIKYGEFTSEELNTYLESVQENPEDAS